ncbi:hypothetical protein IU433_30060 [Nocardia puris]|uniref:beta-ketoacyl synthase N-terminal-like domain-containing protein n=1 Tax=Nocardia puris TaxID=208602 RepID=UPI001894554C|nr:beta-ketoacyl synthase N-terminal-like domain-containing protein [Nocardia puris]MBF6212909.1 hypothetical protein [Nocardia puris]MBF6367900.1 hypothetical protein [Nocardia puris]MBF6463249.1 hypothetical protein [Nocardia puris]
MIGLGCRFAGAESPAALWRALLDEVDTVSDTPPPGRFPEHARAEGPRFAGAYLADVAGFDAEFFGISPREAAEIDPQQRLALELAWEVFEDAGVRPAAAPRTGVYFAAKFNDYRALKLARGAASVTPFTSTGDVEGVIANRVSHALGFDGPSLAVNASCAGSLVAVHLACQALRAGECETAVAGGVHLNLLADTTAGLAALGVLSPTGRSRAFDATADGYARGEGGAAVLLKPLAAARRDGDRVYCVVLGSATNNNGHNPTMPASSADGQRQLLHRALAHAGIAPETVDYVEAHGTGTVVGDRAELTALGEVYGAARAPERPLLVGSVKTNIGHTEAASGLAGLIKTALALHHRRIPRTLHFSSPAPDVDPDALGLRVCAEAVDWPESPDRPARAAVSAFGFGGSNAHVVVEAGTLASVEGVAGPVVGTTAGGTRWWRRAKVGGSGSNAALRWGTTSSVGGRATAELAGAGKPGAGTTSAAGEPGASEAGSLSAPDGDRLVVLSARTEAALREHAARVRDFLRENADAGLDDLAHTLCRKRTHFARRLAVVAGTVDEVVEALHRYAEGAGGEPEPDRRTVDRLLRAALHPGELGWRELLEAVGGAYEQGGDPDWDAVNPVAGRISLPTYPFQRKPYWVSTPEPAPANAGAETSSGPTSFEPGGRAEPIAAATRDPLAVVTGEQADPAATPTPDRIAVITGEQAEPVTTESQDLLTVVTGELAAVTGHPATAIATDGNFADFGFTSPHAIELSNRLAARLPIPVPVALVWGHPTCATLASELGRRMAQPEAPAPATKSTATAEPEDTENQEALSAADLLAMADRLL